jgi:hypothetical protein
VGGIDASEARMRLATLRLISPTNDTNVGSVAVIARTQPDTSGTRVPSCVSKDAGDLLLRPDVFLSDGTVAPLCHGHHAGTVLELTDDARPLSRSELDRV